MKRELTPDDLTDEQLWWLLTCYPRKAEYTAADLAIAQEAVR